MIALSFHQFLEGLALASVIVRAQLGRLSGEAMHEDALGQQAYSDKHLSPVHPEKDREQAH